VLVGIDGRVKLTDFVIARALSGSQATTGQSIKGTLAYLPPEQACGAPVDARADLFAVGALLYELIARAPIYDESDPRLALARARAGDVNSLASVCPETPMAIVELVDRALSAGPTDRFPSARAMAAEQERVADRTGGLAEVDELAAWVRSSLAANGIGPASLTGASSTQMRTSVRKRRLPALLTIALFLAVGWWWAIRHTSQGGSAAAAASVSQPPPSPPTAPVTAVVAEVDPRPSAVQRDVVSAVSSSPAPLPGIKRVDPSDKSSEKGLLDIGSEPAFAYVSIDGVKTGATPIFGRAVAPGTHRIEVSREGLGSKTFSLDVKPGARMSRVVKLP